MRVKPRCGALHAVALVLGLYEAVAFMFVDHQLSFDAQSFQRVPKFVGLWRRALPVAIANKNQRGSFYFFDYRNSACYKR